MDEKMRDQTQEWALRDLLAFKSTYRLNSLPDMLPVVPFTAESTHGMRADSYDRGYRAGYLRYMPQVTVGDLDRVHALRGAAICREDQNFRLTETRGPSWVCFMPAPLKAALLLQETKDLNRILAEVAKMYALPVDCVSMPNIAELMFLFLMERIYDPTWPHNRTMYAISSTIVAGRRLGLHVSHDDRMRLDVTFMPADGPFEGNIFPIAYPPSKQA